MSEITMHAPGTFSWTDAGMTDVTKAKSFYGEVLGWSFNDIPMGAGYTYSMAHVHGKNVAALYPQPPQMREQGIPPNWLCYISVKSADEVASKAERLGGKVLAAAFDVTDAGRMAVLQDPTGAAVALWEPKKHIGASLLKEAGAMVWHELRTTDMAAAERFYTGLLGCEAKTLDMGPIKYTLLGHSERPVGAMMKITPEMGSMQPHWLPYFGTNDCDAAVERARRSGAKILMPPTDAPNVGRFAKLVDPQGAAFAVIKPA